MKPLNIEELDLDEEYDVFYECLRIADDEFCNLIDYDSPVFFYGNIIDEDSWVIESIIDENKTYCLCPSCGKLFALDDSDKHSGTIQCPHCETEGLLVNFRDKTQPLNEMCEQDLAFMQSYKAFQALQKYGFKNLVDAMILIAEEFPDSSKISEVLGADYNQVLAYLGKEISINELLYARKLYKLSIIPTMQNVELMSQMTGIEGIDGFELTTDNAHKTFKYLRNQENKTKDKDKNVGRDYVDYLIECSKLGYDMSDSRILYPTSLKIAHTKTSKLLGIKNSAGIENGVMAAYEKYHELCSYDNGKFCVLMPQHSEDIIAEGKEQSHCVGRYVERVAKGEDIILFVRRSAEKDKPFYTMEIRPVMRKLDIVQCRGYENEDPSPEIRAEVDAFLAEYQNWFNSRKVVFTDCNRCNTCACCYSCNYYCSHLRCIHIFSAVGTSSAKSCYGSS